MSKKIQKMMEGYAGLGHSKEHKENAETSMIFLEIMNEEESEKKEDGNLYEAKGKVMATLDNDGMDIKVILHPSNQFGKVKGVGINQVVDDERDVEDSLETAFKDMFPVVNLFSDDERLVKKALKGYR